jgi:hypothetical protein
MLRVLSGSIWVLPVGHQRKALAAEFDFSDILQPRLLHALALVFQLIEIELAALNVEVMGEIEAIEAAQQQRWTLLLLDCSG